MERLRESCYRHTLGYLEPARSANDVFISVSFLRKTPGCCQALLIASFWMGKIVAPTVITRPIANEK